jgi:hypothetical protein
MPVSDKADHPAPLGSGRGAGLAIAERAGGNLEQQ